MKHLPAAFLGLIALLYLSMAVWCSWQPDLTSAKVGFQLQGASGRSEFITVYGGLEFGLALVFAAGALLPSLRRSALSSCILIHAALVVFRTGSLLTTDAAGEPLASLTWQLAAGEWIILLLGLVSWRIGRSGSPPSGKSQT